MNIKTTFTLISVIQVRSVNQKNNTGSAETGHFG